MAKKVIKDLLKKAMANGDQSSAANAYKSMAAKKDTVSIPKQTYFSTKGGGNVSNKSGGDWLIEKMGKKPIAKKDSTSNPILNKINSIVGSKKKVAPSVKIDSTKKVTPIGKSKPSVIIKKETTIKPAKPIAKKMPYKPAKKEIIKKLMK